MRWAFHPLFSESSVSRCLADSLSSISLRHDALSHWTPDWPVWYGTQTWVKCIIALDSNTFVYFTEFVWCIGGKKKTLRLVILLVGLIIPGKINRAQKSIWIQNNYVLEPGLVQVHWINKCVSSSQEHYIILRAGNQFLSCVGVLWS